MPPDYFSCNIHTTRLPVCSRALSSSLRLRARTYHLIHVYLWQVYTPAILDSLHPFIIFKCLYNNKYVLLLRCRQLPAKKPVIIIYEVFLIYSVHFSFQNPLQGFICLQVFNTIYTLTLHLENNPPFNGREDKIIENRNFLLHPKTTIRIYLQWGF